MEMQAEFSRLEPSDPRWLDFIQACPAANIFHHPAWMELMQACYRYSAFILALSDSHGNIRAGIPLMEVNSSLTGHRWVSLPFSDHCAPLYTSQEALEELTNQLVRLFQGNQKRKMEIRWDLPHRPEIQKTSEFVLDILKLDPDPDRVSQNFKHTYIQNIHTAEEKGVTVEPGNQLEHLKVFYNLQLETRKRLGVPAQPWKYFKTLKKLIFDKDLGFLLLAYKEDQCIAGSIFLHWNKTLMYKYSASLNGGLKCHPNKLILWNAIRWGCDHGFTSMDMGRSDLENIGLRNFKRRWGAVEEPLYYSVFSQKTVQPSSGRLDHLLHYVITNSPIWVCRYSGELLYKHVG